MYNFIPGTIPNNVFVIGGGGTGGRLIPMLSQFLRSITRGVGPNGWLETPRIWLIDDDVVEQKNILRQWCWLSVTRERTVWRSFRSLNVFNRIQHSSCTMQ
jgi:hypothetical protein